MAQTLKDQSVEHEDYHGDVDPGGGAGLGLLAVADQPPFEPKPAGGPLGHPAAGLDLEVLRIVGAFDDPGLQVRTLPAHPRRGVGPGESPPSTHILCRERNHGSKGSNSALAPALSGVLAGRTPA